MKPRLFISAVTAELGRSRQLVANVLSRLGYDPVWQDIFGTEPGDLRQVLRDKIDGCDGLIQLVGRAYGAEPPPVVDAVSGDTSYTEFGRVSYTQFEFLYAESLGKKTWLIFVDPISSSPLCPPCLCVSNRTRFKPPGASAGSSTRICGTRWPATRNSN